MRLEPRPHRTQLRIYSYVGEPGARLQLYLDGVPLPAAQPSHGDAAWASRVVHPTLAGQRWGTQTCDDVWWSGPHRVLWRDGAQRHTRQIPCQRGTPATPAASAWAWRLPWAVHEGRYPAPQEAATAESAGLGSNIV